MFKKIITAMFVGLLAVVPMVAMAGQSPVHLDLGTGFVNQQNPSTGSSANVFSGTGQITVDVTNKITGFVNGSYSALTRTPSTTLPANLAFTGLTFAAPTYQVGVSYHFSRSLLGSVQYGTIVNTQLYFAGESRTLNQLEASLWQRVF